MEAYSAAEAARERLSRGEPWSRSSSPPRARAGGGPRRRRGEGEVGGPVGERALRALVQSQSARPTSSPRPAARPRRWASRRRRRRSRRDLADLDERLARARVAHEGGGAAVAKAHLRGGIGGKALLHREPRDESRAAALSTPAVAGPSRRPRETPRTRRGEGERDARTRRRRTRTDAPAPRGMPSSRTPTRWRSSRASVRAGARTRPRLSPTPARIVRARGWKISPPAFFNDYWHCYIILTFSHTTIP